MCRSAGLALGLAGSVCAAPTLELVSRTKLVSDHEHFGGLSAIEMNASGTHALVLSDRGRLFELDMTRQAGRIETVTTGFVGWLGGDSEGLAVQDDTTWFVSFEWPARVDVAWHACLPSHPDFAEMDGNRELEALAISEEGHLYTLPEGRPKDAEGYPLYRHDGTGWATIAHLRSDFAPVGADFGPDGHLYLLERHFGLLGFQNRILRWDLSTPDPEILWASRPAAFDNLEGLSVWQDKDGQIRISLVSDDNFQPFLRMELVEFVLRD